ncbi:hypothetical protein ACTHSJ_21605 [Paenibacillus cellulositrophicus]|uniref:hypothetical protein n=1 Tax=Paenibacillus cellulositrophicus TaxID=562959 RepID=UPI003F7D2008
MKKKFLLVLLLSSMLATNSAFAAGNAKPTQVSSSNQQQSKSNLIRNNIFNLSDQQIKNAIALGAHDYNHYTEFVNSQNLKIIEDKMGIWQPNVNLSTPYFNIVMFSFLKFNDYGKYSFAEAKKFSNLYKNISYITFNVGALGDSIDFADTVKVVLVQGDKVIQPLEIRIDEYAAHSKFWPDAPAYRNNVDAKFDIKKIDFSKEAKLVYMYAGKELSVTYKVDFTKIK